MAITLITGQSGNACNRPALKQSYYFWIFTLLFVNILKIILVWQRYNTTVQNWDFIPIHTF